MNSLTTFGPSETLPSLIDRAASALASAHDSAEVLEARDMARVAYDAAKSAGRMARAKQAHDTVIAAVFRAQADALLIEARAKARLADEIDAAQERGDIAKRGGSGNNQYGNIPDGNVSSGGFWKGTDNPEMDASRDRLEGFVTGKITYDDLKLTAKEVHEARQIRDAERAAPGFLESAVSERVSMGQEPTKAFVKEVVAEANGKPVRGTTGTGDNEWYTPEDHIERARRVLGGFDVDPASNAEAQEKVRAGMFFDAETNGLAQEWNGRVWLNPPYAQPLISQFMAKLVEEIDAGRCTSAITLTHNYTDTRWFQDTASKANAICFTRGRIRFYSPSGEIAAPTQGQAFMYFGDDADGFCETFREAGIVMVRHE